MSHLQTRLLTHPQKVKSIYKRALRLLEMYLDHRHHFRYNAVLLRAEFDKNKDEKDMMRVKKLLADAEHRLWDNQHYQPRQYWVLDYWHPLEKAMYPEYFARREERKKEYVKWWESQHGKADDKPAH